MTKTRYFHAKGSYLRKMAPGGIPVPRNYQRRIGPFINQFNQLVTMPVAIGTYMVARGLVNWSYSHARYYWMHRDPDSRTDYDNNPEIAHKKPKVIVDEKSNVPWATFTKPTMIPILPQPEIPEMDTYQYNYDYYTWLWSQGTDPDAGYKAKPYPGDYYKDPLTGKTLTDDNPYMERIPGRYYGPQEFGGYE